jgi:hypothetical protein
MMDNLLTNILTYFTDKTRSFGSKSLFLFALLLSLFVFDYFTGFSFYLSTSAKLNQIEKLERIKFRYPDNQQLVDELNAIEKQILTRKTIQDHFSFFDISDIRFVNEVEHTTKQDSLPLNAERMNQSNKSSKALKTYNSTGNRSNLLHILTSSYSFVFFLIMLPFVLFADKRFDRNMVIGLVFMAMMLIGLIWLFSYFLSLIPIIRFAWVNYLINFVLHTSFLLLMWRIIRTPKKIPE